MPSFSKLVGFDTVTQLEKQCVFRPEYKTQLAIIGGVLGIVVLQFRPEYKTQLAIILCSVLRYRLQFRPEYKTQLAIILTIDGSPVA